MFSFVTYNFRDFLKMDSSVFCDGGMFAERESLLKTLYVDPASISYQMHTPTLYFQLRT
jgi:hypothetical protein